METKIMCLRKGNAMFYQTNFARVADRISCKGHERLRYAKAVPELKWQDATEKHSTLLLFSKIKKDKNVTEILSKKIRQKF